MITLYRPDWYNLRAMKGSKPTLKQKGFAKEYGLDQPSHVVVEKLPNGILIKKLELRDV